MNQAQASEVLDARDKVSLWVEIVRFVILFSLIWIALDSIFIALPLFRPGAEVVSAAKFNTVTRSVMFPTKTRNRVMVFGNSRILAGFRPIIFDSAFAAGSTLSFNLGLPGETQFLPILEAALSAGNIPTHVLLSIPWDDAVAPPTLLDKIKDDEQTVLNVMPFRYLPRDAVLFAFQSRMHLLREYHRAAIERDDVLANRGWYFIKSESHYPGDQLPDDFALPTDHPDQPATRHLPANSWVKARLVALAQKYGFRIIFIPLPVREGAVKADIGLDPLHVSQISTYPDMRVVGPDAFTYKPRDFSDPVHLNKAGAVLYTANLVHLLRLTGTLN